MSASLLDQLSNTGLCALFVAEDILACDMLGQSGQEAMTSVQTSPVASLQV